MDVKEVNVKEKKSKKGIVILVSIIILILALLISGYFYLSSPKRIITGYTNSLYNSFEKNSGVNYDSISMNLKVVPTVNNANDKNLETIINKIEFALSGAIDYKNKTLKYNLGLDYDKGSLLDVDMQYNFLLKNDISFAKLNNLYDNPVKIEDNDFSDVFKKSETKDLKVVVKGYIDAFNSSLKDKYMTTKNKDGYRVVTIDLTGDNYKMISKDISNKLLNNKEFIKSYANMNVEEESEVKEDLKDIDDGEFNGIKVSLYTKGLTNETKKISLESEDTKVEVKLLDDNNYKVKITNGDLSIGLDLKYTVSYNTKVEIEEYKNAVDSEKLSKDILSILTKFTSQDSYKKLNNDIKTLTGTSIDELLSSYMTNNETDND